MNPLTIDTDAGWLPMHAAAAYTGGGSALDFGPSPCGLPNKQSNDGAAWLEFFIHVVENNTADMQLELFPSNDGTVDGIDGEPAETILLNSGGVANFRKTIIVPWVALGSYFLARLTAVSGIDVYTINAKVRRWKEKP